MEKEMFQTEPEDTKKSDGRGKGVMWGILVALAVGNIFAIWQTSQTQTQLRELSSAIETRIANMNEQTTSFSSRADRAAAMLKNEFPAGDAEPQNRPDGQRHCPGHPERAPAQRPPPPDW